MNLYIIFPSPDGIVPGTWQNATSFAEAVGKINAACAAGGMDPHAVTVLDATDPSVVMDYETAMNWAAAE